MWTKTASSWKRAASESEFRSDIHRHFSLERPSISCSAFVSLVTGRLALLRGAQAHWALTSRAHSPSIEAFIRGFSDSCSWSTAPLRATTRASPRLEHFLRHPRRHHGAGPARVEREVRDRLDQLVVG